MRALGDCLNKLRFSIILESNKFTVEREDNIKRVGGRSLGPRFSSFLISLSPPVEGELLKGKEFLLHCFVLCFFHVPMAFVVVSFNFHN